MTIRCRHMLTLLSTACLLCAGCGQRTVTTNTEGTRIPERVIDRLSADMSPRDWLELMYGTPDRIEPTEDGGLHLVWVFTRHTQEHRPDPHQETYVEEAHVRLDAAGEIVDARRNSRQSND